jgi:peptidoglycan/xylan/chitin deacetylase (PgdA/CDA1 family)
MKKATITPIPLITFLIILVIFMLPDYSKNEKTLTSEVKTTVLTSELIQNTTIETLTTTTTTATAATPTAISPTASEKKTSTATPKKATPKPTQTTQSSTSKVAYITIDDGPSTNNTPIILDVLKEYNVKATFFPIYHSGVSSIYKRIINEGHCVGNHTYNHNLSSLYTSDATYFKNDVLKFHNYLLDNYNYKAKVFRFPGGSGGRSSSILTPRINYLNTLGYKYYNWTLSVADTDTSLTIEKYGSEENIIKRLTANIVDKTNNRSSIIILMHDNDNKVYTPKALPRIIKGLKEQGYIFKKLG